VTAELSELKLRSFGFVSFRNLLVLVIDGVIRFYLQPPKLPLRTTVAGGERPRRDKAAGHWVKLASEICRTATLAGRKLKHGSATAAFQTNLVTGQPNVRIHSDAGVCAICGPDPKVIAHAQ